MVSFFLSEKSLTEILKISFKCSVWKDLWKQKLQCVWGSLTRRCGIFRTREVFFKSFQELELAYWTNHPSICKLYKSQKIIKIIRNRLSGDEPSTRKIGFRVGNVFGSFDKLAPGTRRYVEIQFLWREMMITGIYLSEWWIWNKSPLKSWIFFRLLYAIVKIAITTARIILHLIIYSRTPLTRTLKGNENLFELAGFRVIGVRVSGVLL